MSRSATVGHAGSDRPAREDDLVDGVPIGSQEVHAGEFLASEVAGRGDAGPLERCDEFQVAGFMPVTGRSGTQMTKSVSVTPECDDQVVGPLEVTQNGLGLSSPVVSLSLSPYRSFQQMFLGDHHLSVLKDQGTGSKSPLCYYFAFWFFWVLCSLENGGPLFPGECGLGDDCPLRSSRGEVA
jgi:hypothetical protein